MESFCFFSFSGGEAAAETEKTVLNHKLYPCSSIQIQ